MGGSPESHDDGLATQCNADVRVSVRRAHHDRPAADVDRLDDPNDILGHGAAGHRRRDRRDRNDEADKSGAHSHRKVLPEKHALPGDRAGDFEAAATDSPCL